MDKKLRIILAVILFALGQIIYPASQANAYTLLTSISDTIASNQPGLYPVYHYLEFTLPYGEIISASDYITISMPYYSQISVSNIVVQGSFVYGDSTGLHATVSGHNIILTNISVVQGSTVYISDFTAQNPSIASEFQEQFTVSTDAAGTNVLDQANLNPLQLLGKSSKATATVEPYAVQMDISGYAYPGLFITVTENGNVLATTTPDTQGQFFVQLTGLSPGTHNFSIYGIDSQNGSTAISTISLFGTAYQTTNYTNLILSPVINVSPSQINQGGTENITGETVPNSTVTISINSPLTQLTATSDSNGNFSYAFNQTSSMNPGQYTVTAFVQTSASFQSIESMPANFTILANSSSSPQPTCNISKADLNCDGHVNLTDFSILMYYWGTNSALADINSDGVVNLVDFSIMMYYWGT